MYFDTICCAQILESCSSPSVKVNYEDFPIWSVFAKSADFLPSYQYFHINYAIEVVPR